VEEDRVKNEGEIPVGSLWAWERESMGSTHIVLVTSWFLRFERNAYRVVIYGCEPTYHGFFYEESFFAADIRRLR
jgi:hypothetical protein